MEGLQASLHSVTHIPTSNSGFGLYQVFYGGIRPGLYKWKVVYVLFLLRLILLHVVLLWIDFQLRQT